MNIKKLTKCGFVKYVKRYINIDTKSSHIKSDSHKENEVFSSIINNLTDKNMCISQSRL